LIPVHHAALRRRLICTAGKAAGARAAEGIATGAYYEYRDANGHKRVVVEHTNDPTRQPHVHAGMPKRGSDPRTYDFKANRYGKIVDKDGDHHIDYEVPKRKK